MRTGNLRHRVDVQRQSTAPKNAMGEHPNTWTSLGIRRAAIRPLAGREFFQASGQDASVNVEIRLRYDAAVGVVKPFDRIVQLDVSPQVVYNVTSVINVRERNRELILMCKRDG